jgi:hypothetical protein
METDRANAELLGVDAAQAAADQTVAAIEEAAKKNQDPAVAEMLEVAVAKADTTSSRVGWLRSLLRRLRRED